MPPRLALEHGLQHQRIGVEDRERQRKRKRDAQLAAREPSAATMKPPQRSTPRAKRGVSFQAEHSLASLIRAEADAATLDA